MGTLQVPPTMPHAITLTPPTRSSTLASDQMALHQEKPDLGEAEETLAGPSSIYSPRQNPRPLSTFQQPSPDSLKHNVANRKLELSSLSTVPMRAPLKGSAVRIYNSYTEKSLSVVEAYEVWSAPSRPESRIGSLNDSRSPSRASKRLSWFFFGRPSSRLSQPPETVAEGSQETLRPKSRLSMIFGGSPSHPGAPAMRPVSTYGDLQARKGVEAPSIEKEDYEEEEERRRDPDACCYWLLG